MGSVRWVAVALAATLGACSGRLEYDIEAYEQSASTKPGNMTGTGSGDGGNGEAGPGAPPASPGPTTPAPSGAGGAGGVNGMAGVGGMGGVSGTGGGGATGGTGGGQAPVKPPVMGRDGGALVEAGGPPDGRPSSPPSSAGCAAGLDALSILARRCGNCHGERTPTKGLDLVTPGVANRLVGVRSGCQARPFLDPAPGAPESYFLEKLDRGVAGCGVQMPFGAPPLNADERACLQDWAEKAIARGVVSGR